MSKIDGWILVDKPVGVTSRDIVNIIAKSINEKKVGHAGTLDKMASGLLAIAIGEATKTIFCIQNMIKTYKFRVRWGYSTTTDDSEGEKLLTSEIRPSKEQIKNVLPKFIGSICQIPPNYSAIKINGIRSYKLARKNKLLFNKPRSVKVEKLKLINYLNKDFSDFEIICSKGTYVRSIARDLGKKLNCYGHITDLRRIFIGKFFVKNAILLDLSKKLGHSPLILKNLISIDYILRDLPEINLSKEEANRIRHGQKLRAEDLTNFKNFISVYPKYDKFNNIYCRDNKKPIAISKIEKNIVRPIKVFNI